MSDDRQTARIRDASVLHDILDHLPASILAKDEALRFVCSNEGHCRLIGDDESLLLGHSDADGRRYLIGTNTGLTEIRKREKQYRALAQTVPAGVWQVDESGETSFANPPFLAYLGLAAEDLPGAAIIRLLGGASEALAGHRPRPAGGREDRAGSRRRPRHTLSLRSGNHGQTLVPVPSAGPGCSMNRAEQLP